MSEWMKRLARWGLDPHIIEIAMGGGFAFSIRLIGAGFSFGFNVALARILGASDAGVYFLAAGVLSVATVFGRIGLDNALLRNVAAARAVGDDGAVRGVYAKGMSLALIASSLTMVVMILAAPAIAVEAFGKRELTVPIRWIAVAVVPSAMLMLHGECLKGLKAVIRSQVVQGLGVPMTSLVVLLLVRARFGVLGAIWSYVGGTLVTVAIAWRWWHRATEGFEKPKTVSAYEILRESVPLFWVASMDMVLAFTSMACLGRWGTTAEVGVFGIASRAVLLTSFALVAVNTVAAPKFAALYTLNRPAELATTARRTALLTTLVATPLFVAYWGFPRLVMGVFGNAFSGGATALVILACGQFVNVATGSVGYLLMMTGHVTAMRNSVIAAAVLDLGLSIALIPRYHVVGAAVATAVSVASLNLLVTAAVRSNLGISMLPIPGRAK